VKASDQFKVLGRYPLRDTCHSTPAVALDHLFVRTEKYLWSIGGKGRKANVRAVSPDPAL
jgi:hypothetical protein